MTIFGVFVSGPLTLALVEATHPQPVWQGARVFSENVHPVQTLPFFGGFFLISGFVMLVGSLHALAGENLRARSSAALVFVAAYAALVCFNYVVQTTFVPTLARHYEPGNDALLGALTMSNPTSLAWGLEMWGYALLGVATWMVADVFGPGRVERLASWAFAANCPVSVIPAVLTALSPGWVMTTAGIVAFALWNALVLAMAALAFVALRHERSQRSARMTAA